MEDKKKRKIDFDALSSPEKKDQRALIAAQLLKLNEGGHCEDEIEQIVASASEMLGEFMQDEYLRRFDKLSDKLENLATNVQIQQLEAQVSRLQDEHLIKDGKIHDLEVSNADLLERVERIEKFCDTAHMNVVNSRNHSINNEQYQRKNNLVVFGVKEGAAGINEDSKQKAFDALKKCKPDLQKSEIDVAHRVGRIGAKPRPIICKMIRHDTRREILVQRKALKGMKDGEHSLSIGEDITREYQELMKNIKSKGFSCWFWNGKVFIQRSDGSSISVQIQDNWELKLNDMNVRGRPPRGNNNTILVERRVFA